MSEIEKPKNVGEILSEWLKEHGYDGLRNRWAQCGCAKVDIYDIGECGHSPMECIPGYLHTYRPEICDARDCEGGKDEDCFCISDEKKWEKEEAKND